MAICAVAALTVVSVFEPVSKGVPRGERQTARMAASVAAAARCAREQLLRLDPASAPYGAPRAPQVFPRKNHLYRKHYYMNKKIHYGPVRSVRRLGCPPCAVAPDDPEPRTEPRPLLSPPCRSLSALYGRIV
jgi:hypothetical protein